MLETLKARKEALEARGESGFTLMEMLIVIAIIAVLIAIAIPIFNTQLEKGREEVDLANIRGAYAAATVAAMNGKISGADINEEKTYYYNPGLDGSLDEAGVTIGQGTETNGGADVNAIKGYSDYTATTDAQGKKISVTFTDGMVSKINFAE